MASGKKQINQLARQLFKLSFVNGSLSGEQVAGVLAYLEKHAPAKPLAVLIAYRRLIVAEAAKSVAVVEHAGPVGEATLQAIASAMTARYQRPVTVSAKPASSLLAGLRVRIGDDVYESSAAGQLAALSASV
ncbi:MAG: F0F1 ATP synthase subunit delta [Verrucomicrobia bacterium]|nr:F0F1 ATP synthase subunit delta [Verrucomicrobiota bacterium]